MRIKFIFRKQVYSMQIEGDGIQVKQALEQLKLPQEAHLLIRGDKLLNEKDWLKDGDEITIVPAISGGSVQNS